MLDARANRFHHLQIDTQKIIAAHAGLPRHAGGDNHDIRTRNRLIARRALIRCIKTVNRRGLGNIQPLALRDTIRNVEEDNITQLFQPREVGERAANLS